MVSHMILLTLAAVLVLTVAKPIHQKSSSSHRSDTNKKQQAEKVNYLTKTILLAYRHRHYRQHIVKPNESDSSDDESNDINPLRIAVQHDDKLIELM